MNIVCKTGMHLARQIAAPVETKVAVAADLVRCYDDGEVVSQSLRKGHCLLVVKKGRT